MKEEWLNEPDFKEFNYRGYKCVIKRISELMYLCGYVMIPKGHPAYEKYYDKLDIDCHGGLTYADYGFPQLQDSESDWVIGFDCAHYMDLMPGMPLHFHNEVYRNMEYVENECKKIVDQLIDMEGTKTI